MPALSEDTARMPTLQKSAETGLVARAPPRQKSTVPGLVSQSTRPQAWTRFEEQLGEMNRARSLLEDGLRTCPADAAVWREYVAFEMRHAGPQAADAARDRARQALAG